MSAMPPRHKLGLALGVLALLALLAQQAGRRSRPADEVDRRLSTLLTGPDGARGLADALERLGLEVRRWRQRPQFLSRDPGSTGREAFVVLDPAYALSVPSMQALLGSDDSTLRRMDLVLAGEAVDPLMGCFGYMIRSVWPDSLRVAPPDQAPGLDAPWVHAHLARRGERVYADSSRMEDIGPFRCLVPPFRVRERLLVTETGLPVALRLVPDDREGREILLVADAELFRNRALRTTDAGPFMVGLFHGRYARATFDEYHQGFGPSGSMAGAVLAWSRRHPLGWAAWQLAVVGLLALGFGAARFGPIRRIIERRRRSPLEHVRALASALAAAKGHDAAIAALVRGLRRRLLPAGQRAPGDSTAWLAGATATIRTARGRDALATLRQLTRPGQSADSVRRAALAVEDLWEDLRS
jgi:hypothetical protein